MHALGYDIMIDSCKQMGAYIIIISISAQLITIGVVKGAEIDGEC